MIALVTYDTGGIDVAAVRVFPTYEDADVWANANLQDTPYDLLAVTT